MMTDDAKIKRAVVTIKIIGVGGGGNNVIERIAEGNELDVELIAINTDEKQLAYMAESGIKAIAIGRELTKGLGTGGVADLGEAAAKGDEEKIKEALKGADLVFVTASMGGGAGTGAAPVVAKLAKDMGILTVGVVTVPFSFEGARKKRIANEGIAKMQGNLDALIVIHNDNLMKLPENKHMSLVNAFKAADDVLRQAINCIAELILTTGEINVDFADLTSTFRQSQSGDALLGIGESQRSAIEAVQRAVESPLVEKSLTGAPEPQRQRAHDTRRRERGDELHPGKHAPRREHHPRHGHRLFHGTDDPRDDHRDGLRRRRRHEGAAHGSA